METMKMSFEDMIDALDRAGGKLAALAWKDGSALEVLDTILKVSIALGEYLDEL